MAGPSDIVESAVKAALAEIEKRDPESFRKLNDDPTKKTEIVEAARKVADETVRLAKEFGDEPSNVEERLAKYLPRSRIDMIKKGLDIPTYRLEIAKRSDGNYHVDITREGKEFMPTRALLTTADVDTSKGVQYASILIEAILLVMQITGISVKVSDQIIAKVAEGYFAFAFEHSSLLQKGIQGVLDAWEDGGSIYDKAQAMFYLIKDSYSFGILWNIVYGLCAYSNMSNWDLIMTIVIVMVQIVVAKLSDGASLVAEIALALNVSNGEFGKKIANLGQLESIKATLSL